MRAGRLDQRVTLQRPTVRVFPDGSHAPEVWEDVATVWATVVSPSSSQRFSAPQEVPVEAFTIWIRWRPEVASSWRVVWEGRPYRITGIGYQGRREAIGLTVEGWDRE